MADTQGTQAQESQPVEGVVPEGMGGVTENGEILDDMAQDADVGQQQAPLNLQAQIDLQALKASEYKALRRQQKTIAQSEKQQGRDHALGYHQIDPSDKSLFRDIQGHLLGAQGFGAMDPDERRKKQLLQQYYEEFSAKGTNIPDVKKQETVSFEDKLFNGFRIDKSMTGKPILSLRMQDDGGRMQQIFDDGKSVRAVTNGPFNAMTAMGMAATFWGHRLQPGMEQMDVRIEAKKTIGGALGGVKAEEKRNLMIVANLHMAHKFGVKANIIGEDIGDFDTYVDQNRDGLEAAFVAYNGKPPYTGKLQRMGEPGFSSLDELLADPEKRTEQDYDIDKADEMELSDGGHDGGHDGGTPPDNGSGGSGAELALPEETERDAQLDDDDALAAKDGEILDADEADPFTNRGVTTTENREAIDGGVVDAKCEDITEDPLQIADTKALPHDPSLDKTEENAGTKPMFQTTRETADAGAAVASEPRASHGNDVPARSGWVQGMINAEKTKTADAALGGQAHDAEGNVAGGASINQPDAAEGPTVKPERRLPGPTSFPKGGM